ncbi:hypothetical protein [Pelosinus propionicus]|nr:hypothetical protein [Pelosinus propionicus]
MRAVLSTSLAEGSEEMFGNPPPLVAGGFSFKDSEPLDLKQRYECHI